MDLKIKDVAELLSVSETTIRRWLLDGKIPAYKLNRQYRFSRIEIENWMMGRKLDVAGMKEAFLPGKSKEEPVYPGNQQFSLYRAINRGDVHTIEGSTKEEVIRNMAPLVADQLKLDPDVLAELLLDREKLMPTAFNNGIAVPHARDCLQQVSFDCVAVAFCEKPIEYGSLDGKPVDMLFFLFATGDKMHLHLLAKIAHLSSDEKALEFLKTHPEKSKLLEFIRSWEAPLKIPNSE